MQTLTYQDTARQLLAQSFEELAAGNSRQASGTGWEATAQMIRAVAAGRGWEHDNHAALFRVIDRLVNETGDGDIHLRFATANALHLNFNENWGEAEYVAAGLAYLRELLDKLERLIDHDTTP